MSERKHLLKQLKDRIQFFSQRKTVGRMKTEHSIFIPTEMLLEQTDEIKSFILTARAINNMEEWKCPVVAEKLEGKVQGIEFVFQFSKDTDFPKIIEYIDSELPE